MSMSRPLRAIAIGSVAAFNLGQLVAGGVLSEADVRSGLRHAAYCCGLVRDDGEESVRATIESGLNAGMAQPRGPKPNDAQSGGGGQAGTSQQAGTAGNRDAAPFKWLDMSHWDDEPVPQRNGQFSIVSRSKQAGLFSGEGGAGKSIIELMKNVAHVAGKDWFGLPGRNGLCQAVRRCRH